MSVEKDQLNLAAGCFCGYAGRSACTGWEGQPLTPVFQMWRSVRLLLRQQKAVRFCQSHLQAGDAINQSRAGLSFWQYLFHFGPTPGRLVKVANKEYITGGRAICINNNRACDSCSAVFSVIWYGHSHHRST